jgi:hypothetical protein
MPKIKLLFVLLFFVAINANAQSLIHKFIENTYVLSDDKKSPDGYYFGNVSYNLKEGLILMINAVGDTKNVKPAFIVKGSVENGIETLPTLKLIDTTSAQETNAVYLINKTDNYTIYFANGRQGEKGTIKTKMGLGNLEWLDEKTIFPIKDNTAFSLALGSLLRNAIFKFNLLRGEKVKGGVGDKPTLLMPGALINDEDTKIGVFYEDFDKNPSARYDIPHSGCTYVMNFLDDESSQTSKSDTTKAIAKYEALKIMLKSIVPSDFAIQRDFNFPLYSNSEHSDRPLKNGRIITFSNNGNESIIDSSNDLYYLLASKKMKVELRLQSKYNLPKIYLRVYSDEK